MWGSLPSCPTIEQFPAAREVDSLTLLHAQQVKAAGFAYAFHAPLGFAAYQDVADRRVAALPRGHEQIAEAGALQGTRRLQTDVPRGTRNGLRRIAEQMPLALHVEAVDLQRHAEGRCVGHKHGGGEALRIAELDVQVHARAHGFPSAPAGGQIAVEG